MGLNVLIVDDSDIIRRMITKTLCLADIPLGSVFEAANGREALEVLDDEWVDVVVADLNMPVMDGMELLKAMRLSPTLSETPVIVVSTEGASTRIAALKDLGVATFVRKPFTPEQIRDAMASLSGLLDADDHTDLVRDLASTVIERFAMMFAEPASSTPAAPSDELLICVLKFSGVVTGAATTAAPLALCAELARTALGQDGGEVDVTRGADVLGEITNMLAGVLGTTVDPDLHTEITPPVVSSISAAQWSEFAAKPHVAALDVEGQPLLVGLNMRRAQ